MPPVVSPHPRPVAAGVDKGITVAVKLAKYSAGAHAGGRGGKGLAGGAGHVA